MTFHHQELALTSPVAWTGNFGSYEPPPLACVGSEKPLRLPVSALSAPRFRGTSRVESSNVPQIF